MRKPIMECVGNNRFTYKYKRTAYAMGIPIIFHTDLNKHQWERLLDGEGYSEEDLDRFMTTGSF
ncbi:hypothetical protein [Dehalobacter restrictus]|uniref:Uncharacterized protein n=1 Tax=Dehalobacter restrictus TaxID=55583 RepID=A0A857DGL2_9FIRM|nr:hypothetical protein [Dehalobacter restrictus]QGZ99414.1 hypothetical protein GQ588_01410 [Dehalobacter restrictus]